MTDIHIRIEGRAGRITLTREKALNALSYDMCLAIDRALKDWADTEAVAVVILDAAGPKAFCAGGDIAELYDTGRKGDFAYGRRFWRDEYRMNARIFEYPKPVVSFLQGFTMGGGVGIGCHGTHRIVGDSSRISMPECGIGLVPDVGGSLLLALAPGRLGEYLGTTGYRMGPGDAVFAGFADHFIPEALWPELIATLARTADLAILAEAATPPPESPLAALQTDIDACFAGETAGDILTVLQQRGDDFAEQCLASLSRGAPLSVAATVEMIHRLRSTTATMRAALELEYRFTWRAMEHGDLLEGVRALIIDKDKSPKWQYADGSVPGVAVSQMLMPLGADALTFEEEE
ncbi:enoyl-CoA hydratase/isomerase family protein [Phaeobacter sp. B1627]|uniref:enoyl-CoA hydratase/isomerase family protein n=1 Tax=Phaeobacter sp. B1627 TaxID=2583809 RepID=UPI00111B6742|nr:enoyl-CoA hydratase/isomerase family protein [Phaeobacter sp. B1627]TNJ46756.1 enoyl-CoA hydratase/isomerase family protein [Phaeobacter sp. B1627]